jgi:hypothetical protein
MKASKMKRITLLIVIAAIGLTASSQTRSSVLFSGAYVYMPGNQLHGAGYSLAYQQEINAWFHLEGGASYVLASNTIERDEVVNAVQLLDLCFHHAGYNFYGLALSRMPLGKSLEFDLFAGPLLSYQSNVFDVSHYLILEETVSIPNYPDNIYKNEAQEGLFFGGKAGFRLAARLGSVWTIFAGGHVNAVIGAESSLHTSLGFSYNW